MKLRSIEYSEEEDPTVVTVTLTIGEAAFLVTALGRMNGIDANAIIPGGDELVGEVYGGLVSVFNRHWDDGVGGFWTVGGRANVQV